MLRDDGSTAKVYHIGDKVSKGILICRNEISLQDHEHGNLAVVRCGKRVRKPGIRIIVDSDLRN
jgi:hypothetical protein